VDDRLTEPQNLPSDAKISGLGLIAKAIAALYYEAKALPCRAPCVKPVMISQAPVIPDAAALLAQIGVVIIGRNEGDRLIRCLRSVVGQVRSIVYVDSGSIDRSGAVARQLGVEVVDLDMSQPYSAARARNAGFARLRKINPTLRYVQFVDGDCEVLPGWLAAAAVAFTQDPLIVAVCGALRERYPEQTVFNRIYSVEWNWQQPGEVSAFGGNVMLKVVIFAVVGGYNNLIIAAEDDELGVRLRQAGGKLIRLDRESLIHDANMTHFGQWWTRAKRCGYAFASVAALHGQPPESKFIKELRRTILWGAIMPLLVLVAIGPTNGFSLLLLLRYPLAIGCTLQATRKRGFGWGNSLVWSVSCVLTAFPGVLGVVQFYRLQRCHRAPEMIAYKQSQ
jgi:GT2 family glycosyltransferase